MTSISILKKHRLLELFGQLNHSVNIITFVSSQSDPIKRRVAVHVFENISPKCPSLLMREAESWQALKMSSLQAEC
jgi:hypothetical protein